MKKSVSFILAMILLLTIVSTACGALKCGVKDCEGKLDWKVQPFGPYPGYHYVYDNYGNRYNCHYTYIKTVNVLMCDKGHPNSTGGDPKYIDNKDHESIYCSSHR